MPSSRLLDALIAEARQHPPVPRSTLTVREYVLHFLAGRRTPYELSIPALSRAHAEDIARGVLVEVVGPVTLGPGSLVRVSGPRGLG
jgi:hypothetical protein